MEDNRIYYMSGFVYAAQNYKIKSCNQPFKDVATLKYLRAKIPNQNYIHEVN